MRAAAARRCCASARVTVWPPPPPLSNVSRLAPSSCAGARRCPRHSVLASRRHWQCWRRLDRPPEQRFVPLPRPAAAPHVPLWRRLQLLYRGHCSRVAFSRPRCLGPVRLCCRPVRQRWLQRQRHVQWHQHHAPGHGLGCHHRECERSTRVQRQQWRQCSPVGLGSSSCCSSGGS